MSYNYKVMAFESEKDNNIQKKPEKNVGIDLKSEEDVLGRLVFSLAGRDCGRYFIAVGLYDKEHILLADGDLRKVEKPKKKKLRHIKLTRTIFPAIKAKLIAGKPILNAELHKAIAERMEDAEQPYLCCEKQ